ncbi:Gx transporter family protein [bacterium]|nr:Gx transporter family protein [bacterium]
MQHRAVKPTRSRRIAELALWTGVASVLFTVEEAVGLPLPFFRLGLANVIPLALLISAGAGAALSVAVLRVLVAGFLTGSLFHPSFVFSATGGVLSMLAVAGVYRLAPRLFGVAGLSILGAFIKNAAQIAVASLLYVADLDVWSVLPLFFLVSVGAGTLVAFITRGFLARIRFSGSSG